MQGTVKWFNKVMGYGFIVGEDKEEYFVHYSGVVEGTELDEKLNVVFDPIESERGKQAQNVSLLQASEKNTEDNNEINNNSQDYEETEQNEQNLEYSDDSDEERYYQDEDILNL